MCKLHLIHTFVLWFIWGKKGTGISELCPYLLTVQDTNFVSLLKKGFVNVL